MNKQFFKYSGARVLLVCLIVFQNFTHIPALFFSFCILYVLYFLISGWLQMLAIEMFNGNRILGLFFWILSLILEIVVPVYFFGDGKFDPLCFWSMGLGAVWFLFFYRKEILKSFEEFDYK